MADGTWDVIVIGGGPAGEVAAGECARRGLDTALVEAELLGGECSYWACVPSKALLRPGQVAWEARHTAGLKSRLAPGLDAAAVFASRTAEVSDYDDAGQLEWARSAGLSVLRGRGRLAGERAVEVEGADGTRARHTARRAVVLATGTRPRLPHLAGLDAIKPWTNREATSASEVPGSLAVIGAGPVGCELAQAWSSLGAKVTLLVRGDRLLTGMEPFVSEILIGIFRDAGIDVRLSTEATHVERRGDRLLIALGGGQALEADQLLVATGRLPATGGLGLETVGLEADGHVEVDSHLRARNVGGGWLYAVGDVNGRNPLTHMGKYQARIAAAVIAGEEAQATELDVTPQVLFTHPQVGSVGLTEKRARDAGIEVRCPEVPMSSVEGASLMGKDLPGRARLVIDARREVLVGATFLGPAAGELLHSATIAIAAEVPLATLWHAVPSFPTVSEVWLSLLEADRDRPR